MNKKIVLFDFDGVIVDTFEAAYSIVQELKLGHSRDQYRRMFEGNIYDGVQSEFSADKFADHHDQWFALYSQKLLKEPLVPGMKKVLATLSCRYILIIISSSITSPIKEYTNLHHINHFFDEIFGADVHFSKVEKIKMVFKKYNVGPAGCIFITDTLGDLKEANLAGVKSLAVTWGFHRRQTLTQGQPTGFIEKPKNMPGAIDQYFS